MDSNLQYLSQIRNTLEHQNYDSIYQSIMNMESLSNTDVTLVKNANIFRVRINNDGEVFTRENQISYISDRNVLNKLTEFGRANKPNQSVFYGTIDIKHPTIKDSSIHAAHFEATSLLKKLIDEITPNTKENFEEIFTVGRWRVLEDIELIEMVFGDNAIKNSAHIRKSYENQRERFKKFLVEEQLKFFSNEFGRDDISKGESYKYKISAGFANCIWNHNDIKVKGIIYPSVAARYKSLNVALLPHEVDKHLKLEGVIMIKCERTHDNEYQFTPLKSVKNLGKGDIDFQWVDYFG